MAVFHRSALARAAVVALLAAGGLATVAAPAQADDQADITVGPVSQELAMGVTQAKAKPFMFRVDNSLRRVAAKDVSYTVDTSLLKKDKVGVVVPDGCQVKDETFTCQLGDLPAGAGVWFGIPLFSTGGPGDAGTWVVTVKSTTADPEPDNNTVSRKITVAEPGQDLNSWVQDVQANVVVNGVRGDDPDLRPVRRGETVPLDWVFYNGGSRKATGIRYILLLPEGVTFAQKPEGCREQLLERTPVLTCEDAGAVLEPGEYYYTADIRVTVGDDVTEPMLGLGDLYADTLVDRTAEVDAWDNHMNFEVFVDLTAAPTPTPTATPSGTPTPSGTSTPGTTTSPAAGGGGGGDGLPVTGVQVGLIGGIGAIILLAGGALLVLSRRRKVVLVAPGDEKSTD
ncbi:cell wall anchor protein [Micromonospora parathelypteridis]|uniref:LPXTG-motif cell wall anchor domain-containing protein n=1 Tax=Micromonospora parathelypteridis TaxID=1839617 RepID=A0A840VNG9_9ACTN|nr:cell wall anchor protein [Micromonospora parathelypteridis]MBB5478633.1 hypothetical protein [Micromonospora parathelypteridis]GGO05330.1 hypothetical protein GCM10011576_07760 [Micromonospora parathelypteridis]